MPIRTKRGRTCCCHRRDSDHVADPSQSDSCVRTNVAGFTGIASETVAINPALAISGIEIMNNWYRREYMAIMSHCANTQIGVWSQNSWDRTIVVAVYSQPAAP
jgi:hypothetical protein